MSTESVVRFVVRGSQQLEMRATYYVQSHRDHGQRTINSVLITQYSSLFYVWNCRTNQPGS
jgi:hypothetical protein